MKSTRYSACLKSRGFSLLEVMVALAILGVAIVAIFQLFSITLRGTKKADDYTKALFYGRSVLDQAYAVQEVEKGSELTNFADDFKAMKEISVKLTSDDEKVKLYQITVIVTWPPSGRLTLTGLRTVYETE